MTSRYEDDPRWQDADRRACEPRRADESPTDHLLRGVQAAQDKYAIEVEYEVAAA